MDPSGEDRLRRAGALLLAGAGLVLLASCIPFDWYYDSADRYRSLCALVDTGKIRPSVYSIMMWAFAAPLNGLGKLVGKRETFTVLFNMAVFVAGAAWLWRVLRRWMTGAAFAEAVLVLLCASMIPRHLVSFMGDFYNAMLVAVGLAAVVASGSPWGVAAAAIGTASKPGTLVGLALASAFVAVHRRRWRYLLMPVLAALLVVANNLLNWGSPFHVGPDYEKFPRLGFTNPFLSGLLSILFSFGKGLLFFAPGLLLLLRRRGAGDARNGGGVPVAVTAAWCLFLGGVVLVYAKYSAWHGDWFWGPRYVVFAAIPASFALAESLRRGRDASWSGNAFALALLLACGWMGICGTVYGFLDLHGIFIANNYEKSVLEWYVPEYTVLGRPLVIAPRLDRRQLALLAWELASIAFLAAPLARVVWRQTGDHLAALARALRAPRARG